MLVHPPVASEKNTKSADTIKKECITLFRNFSKLQPGLLEGQLLRFQILFASLSIYDRGHGPVDKHLRDHPDVLHLVTQKLKVLKSNLLQRVSARTLTLSLRLTWASKVNGFLSESLPKQESETSKLKPFNITEATFVYESSNSEDLPCSTRSSSRALESKELDCLELKLQEGVRTVEDMISHLHALLPTNRNDHNLSYVAKVDPLKVDKDVDGLKTNVTNQLQKDVSQIIAEENPETKDFLKERLAMSITQRRKRFLSCRQYPDTSKTRKLLEPADDSTQWSR